MLYFGRAPPVVEVVVAHSQNEVVAKVAPVVEQEYGQLVVSTVIVAEPHVSNFRHYFQKGRHSFQVRLLFCESCGKLHQQ